MIRANKHLPESPRGITLLVAVIVSTVTLSVAFALLDIAYKQQLLSSAAKQSQFAFYNADSAMECALYYDQKQNAFDYSSPKAGSSLICNTKAVLNWKSPPPVGGIRTTSFDITCAGTDIKGKVIVLKTDGTAVCGENNSHTCIYTTGYSTCNVNDPRRIERGLNVYY